MMHSDHPVGGDKATGDNNQNGDQNSRERRGSEGCACGSAWRSPLLVQPSKPSSLSYQFCSLSGT